MTVYLPALNPTPPVTLTQPSPPSNVLTPLTINAIAGGGIYNLLVCNGTIATISVRADGSFLWGNGNSYMDPYGDLLIGGSGTLSLLNRPAYVAGDRYLTISPSTGVVHMSAIGPGS